MAKINKEEYDILKSAINGGYEWIARDKNNALWIYIQKPQKDTSETWIINGTWATKVNINLFQFIKWEDEEPHNIVELIKEYEIEGYKKSAEIGWNEIRSHEERKRKESEEKEMKKGKEWLKEEITEILLTSKKDGTNYFYYRDLKEKIYNAINQLDETEVYEELEE